MRFAVRFARTRWRRLVGITLITVLTVSGIALTTAVTSRLMDDGAAQLLTDADPRARAAVVSVSQPGAAESNADAAERALHELFAGLPVALTRTDVFLTSGILGGLSSDAPTAPTPDPTPPTEPTAPSEPTDGQSSADPQPSADQGSTSLSLLVDADIADHAVLDSGAWPTGDDEVAVLESTATGTGLTVGSTITVGEHTLTVSGIWHATNPADARWHGAANVVGGHAGSTWGPVIAQASVITTLGGTSSAEWTITPTALTISEVEPIQRALGRAEAVVTALDPGSNRSVAISGELDQTLTRISAAALGTIGVLLIPLLTIMLLGGVVLWLTTSALSESRQSELALLRGRGASRTAIAVNAGLEAGVAAALGGAIAGIAAAPFGALPATAVAAGVAIGAAMSGAAVSAIRSSVMLRTRTDAGWRGVAALGLSFLLVAAAAGLALAQLWGRRSFVSGGQVDPVASAAPALALLACAFAAPVLALPIANMAERLARSGKGIIPVLPLRRIARQATTLAAGVLCVALAAGAVVLGGAIVLGTRSAQTAELSRALGGDVRVVYDASTPGASDARLAIAADVPGVESAFAVLSADGAIGSEQAQSIAAPATDLAVSSALQDSLHTAAEIAPIQKSFALEIALKDTSPESGIVLDDGTVIESPPAEVSVTVWAESASGTLASTVAGTILADGAVHQLTTTAAPGSRIMAMGLSMNAAYSFFVPDLAGTITQILDGVAEPEQTVSLSQAAPNARVLTPGLVTELPIVITQALATELGLDTGDDSTLSIPAATGTARAQVIGIVPALPGATNPFAFASDLQTLQQVAIASGGSVVAPNEVWVRTAQPESVGAALREEIPEQSRVLTPQAVSSAPVVDAALITLGIGTIAVAILAAVGFGSVVGESRRERAGERLALRAVGMDLRTQRRSDRYEAIVTVIFAIVVGAGAGLAVAALIVPIVQEVLV